MFSALLRVACALGLLLTFTLTLIMESNTPNDPEVSFDAIVIGSGYGGSVSAYRLAKAGLKVAVIESGYAHKAPNILRGEASQWNPAAGLFGPHTVTHLSNTVTAWTGTAVGGGSIVNAAVMIRKDNFENWPGNISRQALEPYYDRAEAMLGAKTYPVLLAPSPYSSTIKSKVMLEAGRKLGVPTVMPPVAITYRETDEPVGTVKINQFGAAQQGCRQCGECSLPGCNYQAKNSLDFNYLYGAQHQFGAVILPGQKADIIEPLAASSGGGYRVTTIDSKSGVQKTYRAKVVVVAAGAVGSSQLLLRNKLLHKTLPALSARLGQQYTTNGTYIGFATRSKTEVDPSGGPEITAGLDFNGPDGKNQGVLMFDGSFRGFTYDTFYITGRLIRLNKLMIKLVSAGFALAEKVGLVRPATTLPLLVIGRDNAVGQFSLNKKGLIQTDLKPQDNASFYKRADEHLRAFTKAMGTRFLPFPYWKLQSKIDVPHNLGGVPMGSAAADGVVDHFGRVFGYDNLFVLDGSIIPATMGANPALTIAALAERSMEHVVPELLASGVSRAEEVVAPRFAPARDLTEQFHRLHEQVKNGAKALPTPEALKGKTVLFTPGFLARHMGNHSTHLLARIEEMGLKVRRVAVDSDVATAANLQLITEEVHTLADGEGILLGHSRGGIMNVDAYRMLSEAEKAKIAYIVLLQSPVNGSPVADFMVASNLLRKIVGPVSRLVLGNNVNDTLLELSTKYRAVAERVLPPLTAADRAKIVTLRSIIGPRESTTFEAARMINKHYGHKSDGLVPHALSEIPGTRDVTLLAYDHEHPVIQEPTWGKRVTLYKANKTYHSGDVIEVLLRLVAQSK